MNTTYDNQATEFLTRNGLKLRITISDSKEATWSPSGHHYRVTLSRKGNRLTFDFWGSAQDMQRGVDPTAYDILACLSIESGCPDTFEDFCAEYGYEEDSINALQTFRRCSRFAKRLQAFFTEKELTELREIN